MISRTNVRIWSSLLRTSRASYRRFPVQPRRKLVLDDHRLGRVPAARANAGSIVRSSAAATLAHVLPRIASGTKQARIGRVVVQIDPIHRLQEHEIRHGSQDGQLRASL